MRLGGTAKTHLVGQLFSQIEPQNAHTYTLSARNEHRETAATAAAGNKKADFSQSHNQRGREDHEDPVALVRISLRGKKREKIRTLSWLGTAAAAAFCSNTETAR